LDGKRVMSIVKYARRNSMSRKSAGALRLIIAAASVALVSLTAGVAMAWYGPGALVIDHNCTDLQRIPIEWINAAKANTRMYYGHLSHGEQITGGLERIETSDPFFAFEFDYRTLPSAPNIFSINDDLGVTPELYWRGEYGIARTRDAINAYPGTNVSMFMWCDHLTYYTAEEVDEYLASMEALEAEFPDVTFIYATAHAQNAGVLGYNRWLRNEQIRAYCIANEKVLFDFADMDIWWFNPATSEWEQNSYQYEGYTVPIEHPQYYPDEWGHTTFEQCELKGSMMWWLVSVLAGWPASGAVTGVDELPAVGALEQNFPNPFNPNTRLAFNIAHAGHVRLDIFDAAGRYIRTLVDEALPAGRHEAAWNGRDSSGRSAASGVYFYSITADGLRDTKKMILLR